ncbi:GNAT family N-acetyltransferase [Streptomyces sp. 351MFTsu5.1]|uniref:GNAT family N-acetyltransferase n=1 Tax=Streptomyces sp. 351MFTsu5.1 TaxID=1172180 RepID=UPI00036EF466|nr:GNAT family N-acetyltransferase [Streptomyces sp. 351MFTsu5.1]
MPRLTPPDARFQVSRLDRRRAEAQRPRTPDRVPMTNLWYVQGDTFLGTLSIRHRLTLHLLELGGHIGYAVRPGARRRGHATAMLRAALPVCRQLGIERALITCDVTNTASRKVIEANGGEFEDRRGVKLRFWIRTGN